MVNKIDADSGTDIITRSCLVSKANRDPDDHSPHAVKCVETRASLIKLVRYGFTRYWVWFKTTSIEKSDCHVQNHGIGVEAFQLLSEMIR